MINTSFFSIISIAASFAPPCKGPRNEPIAPVTHEWISDNVDAQTRAVKVDALNSCSAYKISEALMTVLCNSFGFFFRHDAHDDEYS